jgi:signal peptidase II
MDRSKRWWLFVLLVGSVLVLDQSSKFYVHTTFMLHESRPVLASFFHLTYVRNPGAAFGLLARQDTDFRRFFFPVVTSVAVLALMFYFSRIPSHRLLTLWGIGLIVGGALGNGIDRLWLGQVIDFLDFYWRTYHWPAFNLADSAICVGVGLLLLDAFRPERPRSEG